MQKRFTQIMVILIRIPHHPLHRYVVLFHLVPGIGGALLNPTLREFTTNLVRLEGIVGDPDMIMCILLLLHLLLRQHFTFKRSYEDWTKATVPDSFHFLLSLSLTVLLRFSINICSIQVVWPKCPWYSHKFPKSLVSVNCPPGSSTCMIFYFMFFGKFNVHLFWSNSNIYLHLNSCF